MTLSELRDRYLTLAEEAKATGALVPAERIYHRIAEQLADVDGAATGYATTAEAAEYLKLQPDTISRKAAAGEFEGAVKDGRGWLLPWQSVHAYLSQGKGDRRDKIRLLKE